MNDSARKFDSLPRQFFTPAADRVAPLLLGHWIVRRTPAGLCAGLIVETEAYLRDDQACHAFRGRTRRNQSMWGPPGTAYVYFIYGNHYCVNAVCQPEGVGEAVLIRAIEPVVGADLMARNRPNGKGVNLSNGPAKLCEAMDIGRTLDGIDLCDPRSGLLIAVNGERDDYVQRNGPITAGPRIGLTRAVELPLRFCLSGSGYLSRRVGASPRGHQIAANPRVS